ncbi:MAG: DUF924 family protein [Alphaproteobacteria bacterium]
MNPIAEEILTFWFGTTDLSADIEKRDVWFKSTPEFDAALTERFESVHRRAAAGELDHLMETLEDCVALAISLDQFPRNIYRGTPRAFEADPKARTVTRHALNRGYHEAVSARPRQFLILPLVHSEELDDQHLAVELYATLDDPKSLEGAKGHRDAIARFGRFPHRNKVLGRASTPEEDEYLRFPPTWGMTKAEAEERERLIAEMEKAQNG